MPIREVDETMTERELDELQQWLQQATLASVTERRYARLAAALQQLRSLSGALRRDNGRLRERIRLQVGRHDDVMPLRERRAAPRRA